MLVSGMGINRAEHLWKPKHCRIACRVSDLRSVCTCWRSVGVVGIVVVEVVID